MNIYLIQEDGISRCWQAETMTEAIMQAQQRFVDEERGDWDDVAQGETPIEYYQRTILESCTLVGELANPAGSGQET